MGKPNKFIWKRKEERIGVFKKSTNAPIYLTKNDVINYEV